MSNQASGEKTEQPTPKKLRDARKKGQVAKSQEVASTAVVLTSFAYIWAGWSFINENLQEMLGAPIFFMNLPFMEALGSVLMVVANKFIILSVPLVLATAVAGVAGNLIQIGFLVSFESVTPKFDKIHPKQWVKKVISKKNLFEFGKSLFKILFLVYLLKWLIEGSLQDLTRAPEYGIDGLLTVLAYILRRIVLYCAAVYVTISALDYLLQKHLHIKELMMTKDEVKREFKEMEGDPHIKSKRKQIHQEMVMNDNMQKVKKSSVLITNPTHIAVAVFYDEDETDLPVITAMGKDFMALRMIEAAKEAGVPIMRNVPLARDLWEQGNLMQYIPSELIEPIAEVLKWVEDVTRPLHS
ncbi:MAG: type III secretion system export apparatus subunit SctU [Desulfovibrionales bacterium]|nr:type III secretion system export apparatus subunit SctU [Desulfovibrionales bacterium]